MIKVTSKEKAWEEVNKIFPTDYEKDYASSERAGYDIYRHATLNYYNRICDLGNRLEVLTGEWGENVTNIWIEEPKPRKKPLTFTAIVTYEILNGKIMTKEMTGVERVDRCYEKLNGENTELFKVHFGSYNAATWAAGAIIKVALIAE
jgi:hypothetical protein